MPIKDWTEYGMDEILQWLANAYVTYVGALGHSKGAANWKLVEEYRAELIKRGMGVPPLGVLESSRFKDDLAEFGEFNGKGSS